MTDTMRRLIIVVVVAVAAALIADGCATYCDFKACVGGYYCDDPGLLFREDAHDWQYVVDAGTP
jgi:hypothetical protein